MAAFLSSWSWDPTVIFGILLAALWYAVGWRRACRRGPGCPMLSAWRACCFGAGLASIGLALLSPIEVFGELFFFMHMTQHLLLVLVAAPLLLLGAPLLPLLWALPRGPRILVGGLFIPGRPLARTFAALTNPVVAATLFVGAMAAWHLPFLYDAAQGRTAIHNAEHSIFLGTALLYWWPVIHPTGGRRRLSYLASIPYLFPCMLEGNLIGALLTFADHPLYATYLRVPRLWGISLLQDQQLAGLIMWVPGGFSFLIPIFVLLGLAWRQEERAAVEAFASEQGFPGDRGAPHA